jgi:high-affinity nickel-transport protein
MDVLARDSGGTRRHAIVLLMQLLIANILIWGWAWRHFQAKPAMLGIAALAWTFGLRHAFDADHIAAIDNVTRRQVHAGRQPTTVGLWFAFGHSTVVMLATVGVAYASASTFRLNIVRAMGSVFGTIVSATFLLAVGIANLFVLLRVWRSADTARDTGTGGGPITWLAAPLLGLASRPWHMLFVGFLFGLGFDTASEIAVLGLSSGQAAKGVGLHEILVLPLFFTAGMALVDTADGLLMLGTYRWSVTSPEGRMRYNSLVTLASALIAITVGVLELSGSYGLSGLISHISSVAASESHQIGMGIVALFLLLWLLPYLSKIVRWPRASVDESCLDRAL